MTLPPRFNHKIILGNSAFCPVTLLQVNLGTFYVVPSPQLTNYSYTYAVYTILGLELLLYTQHCVLLYVAIAIIPGCERNLDQILTDDDLQEVYEAVYEARDKWFNMGMALKLKVGSLNAIKAGSGDVDEKCLNMLQEWLHNGTSKTWRAIAEVLGSKTVARDDLKVQILS